MRLEEDRFKPVYSIGEASKKLGIVVPLLRLLERSGLLISARNEYGKRLYSQCDLDYIRALIDLSREYNWTLEEAHQHVSSLKCWEKLECSPEQRRCCPKYQNLKVICWVDRWRECKEEHKDCRECEVYRSLYQLINS